MNKGGTSTGTIAFGSTQDTVGACQGTDKLKRHTTRVHLSLILQRAGRAWLFWLCVALGPVRHCDPALGSYLERLGRPGRVADEGQ